MPDDPSPFYRNQAVKQVANLRFDQCCAWKSDPCMAFFIKQSFLIRRRCGILEACFRDVGTFTESGKIRQQRLRCPDKDVRYPGITEPEAV